MKFNFPINNFSSGEWSPRMMGRTDTEQYARACAEMTNMISQTTGGAQYRPGLAATTILDGDCRDHLNNTALFGDPYTAFKLITYRPAQGPGFPLLLTPGKWFMLPSGVQIPLTSGISLATWDPQQTKYTQLGDVLILVDGAGLNRPKMVFYNTFLASYVIDNFVAPPTSSVATPWKAIPWGRVEALGSNVTLNPSATTGTVTVTASGNFFSAGMIGTYLRFCNGTSKAGVGRITAVGSAVSATVVVLQTLPSAPFAYGSTSNSASFWQQSAWSDVEGWPRTVAAHEGRLIFGGSSSKPDTIWGSRISNAFDFEEIPSPDTTGPFGFAGSAFAADNSRPFTLTPNSALSTNIVALSSAKSLVINTDRSEIVAYGSNGALGPNNVVFESSTSFGAENVQPLRINNYLTFIQRGGRKVRDIIFNFEEDQYKATDLSLIADHFTLDESLVGGIDRISEMCATELGSSIAWIRTRTGKLFSLTLDRDYQVNSWARITLGQAPEQAADTHPRAAVLAMCAHPASGQSDTLHVLVLRMAGGSIYVSYEVMSPAWEWSNPGGNVGYVMNYLDGMRPASPGVGIRVWNTDDGITDSVYKNTTVSVIADGNYIGDFLAANTLEGEITLPADYSDVWVGYKYLGRLVTMPLEQGGQTGTPMGRQKRINEMVIRFYNTAGCFFGKPDYPLDEISFRDLSGPLNTPIQLFTGDKVVDFPPGYERKAQVIIEQRRPYPMHIIAVVAQGTTYD